MTGYDACKSFCMGEAGKLIQVTGNTFELGHEVQMFAAQAFAYHSRPKQLSDDLGRTLARCAGQCPKT